MGTAIDEMPTWLDRDYVQSLLRENVKGLFVVQSFDVTSAVGKGENYASQLHRVTLTLKKGDKTEPHYLVIKSLPTSEMMKAMLLEGGIFEKEISMYSETLPALDALEKECSKEPVEPFFCKSFKTSRPYTIVMEDLSRKGYKVANRFIGLDLNHSKLAIKAMARLHALSLGLLARDPTFIEKYRENMIIEEKRELTQQFVVPGMEMLAAKLEQWPGYERFGPRLKSIQWTDRLIEMFKINNDIAVLNHGDGWLNNMMFQYSEKGDVQNVKFVDFQMCRYGSPGIDIQYFMHTSPSGDVRDKHWDVLLEEYHSSFVKTLTSVGGNPKLMSLKTLKRLVDEKLLYGVFAACVVLPIVLADPDDAPNMDEFLPDTTKNGEDAKIIDFGKTYGAPRFRAALQKLLLKFEASGIV